MSRDYRKDLFDLFKAGLQAVHGRHRVEASLRSHEFSGPVWVISIGKAAVAMADGANRVLGQQLQQGLLITKAGYGSGKAFEAKKYVCYEAGHPLPDARSLEAGQHLLDFLGNAPSNAQFLFLISGGASSLVEVLPDGVMLEDLQRANTWLLASGLPIQTVNQIRKKLSCIKGGGLIQYLGERTATVLIISDVLDDDPSSIGSGLLTVEWQARDWETIACAANVPDWLSCWMRLAPAVPNEGDSMFANIETHIVGGLQDACRAVREAARHHGYRLNSTDELLQGDAERTGRELAIQLLNGPSGVWVWGGETTLKLPDRPGRGGRNQHLALAAAMELSGHAGVWLLSAGTDGTDGPTEDAGAIVDGETIARGQVKQFDPMQCLASADTGSFLNASGDLVQTGPTGTNVMDLVIGLKQ